ncbi:hypothetical protein PIB30_063383 [Stylosanthes scabra]|uniref:Uncharacterized protein n=1 Tax=Stylosanthes scabra TaxID=79078 RepID=A0ABU6WP77_9FABA|nr:hypothetical protein [Stylosanthes scabra]
MDRKRKSEGAKGKGKLTMSHTQKSPRLAGLPPFVPPTSPKSVLRPNKLLVLAIAADAVEIHPKARGIAQATIEKPPIDIKGKKTARISVKPLRKRDEEEEVQDKEATTEEPPLVANQAEEKEEEEDPEEYPPPYSPLPPLPASLELGSEEYDDPHNWNYDGDLDQWEH